MAIQTIAALQHTHTHTQVHNTIERRTYISLSLHRSDIHSIAAESARAITKADALKLATSIIIPR